VQNLLADAILTGKIQPGDSAVIDVSDDGFWVETPGGHGARETASPKSKGARVERKKAAALRNGWRRLFDSRRSRD
jgi:hypothetical protein